MRTFGHFIDGRWTDFQADNSFVTKSPATGRGIGGFHQGDPAGCPAGHRGGRRRHSLSGSALRRRKGVRYCLRAADLLRQRKDELGAVVTREMGKVLAEGRGDVQEAIDFFEYIAGEGRRLFGEDYTFGTPGQVCHDDPAADRRRWLHNTVELSHRHSGLEARCRVGGGQHGGVQAG